MKILFVSDIHGVTTNLGKIKDLISTNNFDKIVILGDLYYLGPNNITDDYSVPSVKEFLMNYSDKIICIKGNCDSDVDIKATDFPICTDLSLIYVDGVEVYLTHGDKYNIESNNKFNRRGILVYGHKHYPFIEKKGEMTYINPGSIAIPRNNSEPSYMIYENKTFTIYNIKGETTHELKLD